ncbi:MAG: phosphoribosyl-ATP diphosphatase [Clostridiaceae bacterium]
MENNEVLKKLYNLILDRKNNEVSGSYTNYLFTKGKNKILKKIGEEATEVIVASKDNDKDETVLEICDLAYHVLVLMAEMNISLDDVTKELNERSKKIANSKGDRKDIEIV